MPIMDGWSWNPVVLKISDLCVIQRTHSLAYTFTLVAILQDIPAPPCPSEFLQQTDPAPNLFLHLLYMLDRCLGSVTVVALVMAVMKRRGMVGKVIEI
jgi:hypothetical protein